MSVALRVTAVQVLSVTCYHYAYDSVSGSVLGHVSVKCGPTLIVVGRQPTSSGRILGGLSPQPALLV